MRPLRRGIMQAKSVHLGRAFSVGLDAFRPYPGLVIGVPALYFVLNMAGQSIPVLQALYMIFI